MNPRNPYATTKTDTGSNPIEETESASEKKEDIASSSRTEINPTVETESAKEEQHDIGSSSKTEINPVAETENPKEEQDIGSSSKLPNPVGETEEVTEEDIGSSSKLPNPVGETEEVTEEDIASSSKLPNPVGETEEVTEEDIASFSKLLNPVRETEEVTEEDIASSLKIPNRIVSSSSLGVNDLSSRRTELDFATRKAKYGEKVIIDPATNDTYFLEKLIGHYFRFRQCLVYKARYSKYSPDAGRCIRSGYVTLKTISMDKLNAFNELRSQAALSLDYPPDAHLIGVNKTFHTARNLYCVSLPFMSDGSLVHILRDCPESRMPEDQISAILRVVLLGLRDELHIDPIPKAHNTLNVGDIFVHIDNGKMSIKLAYGASVYHAEEIDDGSWNNGSWKDPRRFLDPRTISQWGAAPEVYRDGNEDKTGPKSDIWLFGLTALNLAYGNLPVKNRTDLNYIIKKIREKNKFPKSLERLLSKRNEKFKKVMDFGKRKKRAFSEEFEEMVLACLEENPEKRQTAAQLLNAPFFVPAIERFKKFTLSRNNRASADNGAVEQRRQN